MGLTGVECSLFGIVYRYAVRKDIENIFLKVLQLGTVIMLISLHTIFLASTYTTHFFMKELISSYISK